LFFGVFSVFGGRRLVAAAPRCVIRGLSDLRFKAFNSESFREQAI
jgi:hypothetical protein